MTTNLHPWGQPPWRANFQPTPGVLPERADFAIVGGGFTGLAAAAWVRRLAPKKSVVVLEAATIGEGASGRTGGLALAETAAGGLPGLGDVLAGYQKILRALRIDGELELPGAWELGRSHTQKDSPICWNDSGELKVVRRVPGGAIHPGKVLSGLARAAEKAGAQIFEYARAEHIRFSKQRLQVRCRSGGRPARREMNAGGILLATNAYSERIYGLPRAAPRLTFALATRPLSRTQLRALGLISRRPFYTVDFPYLWGRVLKSHALVFGAGLVPEPASFTDLFLDRKRGPSRSTFPLYRFDVRLGAPSERLRWLEHRVRHLHPALQSVEITHRWGGPILFTENMRPIFQQHPRNRNVFVLGGYNGHGVALSVYLGKWAAEALLRRRSLPRWS